MRSTAYALRSGAISSVPATEFACQCALIAMRIDVRVNVDWKL